MGEIKSALEIAMEKAERLGKASKEELEKERWQSKGKKIAAQYINGEIESLRQELEKLPPGEIQEAISGAVEVLIRNIILPRDKFQWDNIKKAISGLTDLKGTSVRQVTDRIVELLKMYEHTVNQYQEQVKAQFQAKLGGLQQAIAQQYGQEVAANLDLEALPEFQQEWGKIRAEIDSQFEEQLNQMKAYLANLPF